MKFPEFLRPKTPESKEKYEYFSSRHERHDIYLFTKNLTNYLEREGIRNIMFVDRSARPAWVGVSEYWNNNFPGKKKPGMYFINPTAEGDEIIHEFTRFFKSIGVDLEAMRGAKFISGKEDELRQRNRALKERFEEVYTDLVKEKSAPLVVFDTCAHTGMTMHDVTKFLEEVGFEDIRIITANRPDRSSEIRHAERIDRHIHMTTCYPFGSDSLVTKGNDIVSERDDEIDRTKGLMVREEIKRIVKNEGR
jgi:hypothetical protein